ncbi:MAG: MBL fold metallo-hydrolase [Candidatus Thermoplasmatota archaeon]|nr:MBL fold metallo-hydrolase [Candidatus Thermoplasmatota archaeon]
MPVVRPVWSGHIVRKGSTVIEASSSVTLIEASGKRVLVDTGSPKDEDRLLKALARMGVTPELVSLVVNTHMHIDHCGCNDLFSAARVVAHESEAPPVGSAPISGRQPLLPGIELVPTPGHSEGSMSVFVTAEKRYAICGDAIPTRDNYEKWVPPFINIDRRLALASMELIWSWADVIIPGHDSPIQVRRKK